MSFLELIVENYPRLLLGLLETLKLTIWSLLIAIVIGLIFGLMTVSKKKIFRGLAMVYIDIIRGTPLLVQAFFIYFGVPTALGLRLDATTAAIITLSLNAGAYMAEIFRGGIQSIGVGQMEAARSLGLSHSRAMVKVVLPQAVRVIIPSLINQFIITLKDTSILSAIGLRELTQTGKIIIAANMESFKMWSIVAIMYFIVIFILSKVSNYLERRISYGKKA